MTRVVNNTAIAVDSRQAHSPPTGRFSHVTSVIARELPPIRVDRRGRAPELCESAKGEVKRVMGADPF
jgi:hypothetical protein